MQPQSVTCCQLNQMLLCGKRLESRRWPRKMQGCGEVGRNGVKKWYGVRERGGGGGGGGFEAGDTSGDVLDEIVTSAKAFGFGRFGGPGR